MMLKVINFSKNNILYESDYQFVSRKVLISFQFSPEPKRKVEISFCFGIVWININYK